MGGDAVPKGEVFISYSRADNDFVAQLQRGLEERDRKTWVDWQDIPPTAEWMQEIRGAIDAADAVVFVLSPDSSASKVCSKELDHASAMNKRIVPILARPVDPATTPGDIASLNWIVGTDRGFDAMVEGLVEALDTDLERVRAHSRLLVRSREWNSRGEDRALLLRGSELTEAEEMVGLDADPRATPDQTRFVVASRQASARRQRGVIAGISAVLVLSAVLGVFAWAQRGQAIEQRDRAEQQTRVARSQALAATAIGRAEAEPDLGILLGIEADRVAKTPESQQALQIALQRSMGKLRTIRGHEGSVNVVAYSPDGALIATGSDDDTVMLTDAESGHSVGPPLVNGDDVLSAAFSPDGKLLATGSKDGSVILWDVETGEKAADQLRGRHTDWAYELEFNKDGTALASGGLENRVIVWDVATRGVLYSVPGVMASFSLSGELLATADGNSVRMWDARTGRRRGGPLQGHTSLVNGLAFARDELLASGSFDGTIRLWDPRDGSPVGEPLRGHSSYVYRLDFSPDGSLLASVSDDGTVRVWDRRTGEQIGAPLRGHSDSVFGVAFSPDGKVLASSGHDGTAILWDVARFSIQGDEKPLNAVTFNTDGDVVFVAGNDGFLRSWDLDTATPRQVVRTHQGHLFDVALSPAGDVLATGGGDGRNGTIRLWNAGDLRPLGILREHRGDVYSMSFSPDGSLLASGGEDGIRLWNIAERRQEGPLIQDGFGITYSIAFSPDSSVLAAGTDDGGTRLWSVENLDLNPLLTLSGHSDLVWAVSFSPDGSQLATGSKDGSIYLWDTISGKQVGNAIEQVGGVTSLAFDTSGDVLASGSHLRTVSFWDAALHTSVGEPVQRHGDFVTDVAFGPDGRSFMSASDDGTLFSWDSIAWISPTSVSISRLCAVAGRNLTASESADFLGSTSSTLTCSELPSAARAS